MKGWACRTRFLLFSILLGVLTVGGLLAEPQPVVADEIGPGTQYCMQPRFNAPNGANKNGKLNCTANDVSLTNAKNPSPSSCTEGTKIPVLSFDVDLSLSAGGTNPSRTDLGFYWNTGANKTNGARGGGTASCQIVTISPGDAGYITVDNPPQTGDVCGDIDSPHNGETAHITLTDVDCQGVPDPANPGQLVLSLPYCSSWFIPGADLVCTGPLGAWPANGAKCKCDDQFTIPVIVQKPEGSVSKTATKAVVTYSVTVTNTSSSVTVDVTKLDDSHYGDITTDSHNGIIKTTCNVGDKHLEPAGSGTNTYTCTFDVQIDNPGSATAVSNVVTAELTASAPPNNITTADSNTVKVVVDLDAP
jgi:hypothetical protein